MTYNIRNLLMRFALFLLVIIQLSFSLSAQTTIWSEDFSGYANGTLSGNGTGTSTATWNSVNGAPVNGGRILANDTNNFGSSVANPLIWITDPINVNGFSSVSFVIDVDAFAVNQLENSDNFAVQYRIDGGVWQTIFSDSGNASEPINGSYISPTFTGNNLEIRATFHNTASNETYTIENIVVTGANDTDGDGIEDSIDNCVTVFNPIQADFDGDGVGNFCDLDDDNDGILDSEECTSPSTPEAFGSNLVLNPGFEEGYRYWTSDFNRGRNNSNGGGGVPDTSGSCGAQGWIAVSPFSSTNGSCGNNYNYYGGQPDGSQIIIDADQTGDNIYNDTNSTNAGACINAILPDHTTGTGNSVYIDPNNLTGVNYWEQTVYGIETNTNYYFAAYIMVIENTPILSFNIDGVQVLGPVTLTRQSGGSNGPDIWQEVAFVWNSGSNTGAIDLSISNETGGCNGNDLRLDDITFAANLSDADNDGIADCLDNDVDNDGCPDALEADGGITWAQLDSSYRIIGAIDANGIPVLANGGQLDVSGYDPTVFGAECPDNDNDLIIDDVDLDDDNDGILDSEECIDTGSGCLTVDDDGDGVFNYLDLDSDNDGIYDAVEAGHDQAQANGRLTGGVGTDGVPNTVQNSGQEDTGLINYSLLNSDATGLSDFRVLDSDGDGCNDVLEAGYSESTTSSGELLGTGYDPENGVVTGNANGYTNPDDGDGNSTYDFREAGTVSVINTHPANQNKFVNDTATFTINVSNVNVYQWQLSTDGGLSYSNLTDNATYSGTQSATLSVQNVTIVNNQARYRVEVSNSAYTCDLKTSNPAILTVNVRTVITNRRITHRVKKN